MIIKVVISLVAIIKLTLITDGNDIYNNYHGNTSGSDYVRINDADNGTNKKKNFYKNDINDKCTINGSNSFRGDDGNNTGISSINSGKNYDNENDNNGNDNNDDSDKIIILIIINHILKNPE